MTVEEVMDRLYGLPLDEFTGARNEAVRELRKAGERDAADRVKALRKPNIAAAAVNRLVREHRGEVEGFLAAAAALRDAQFSGEGDLTAAMRQEQEALERLTGIGGEAVRQSLLAAAVDDGAAQQLREARLERELEPAGFGTLLAHAPATGGRPRPPAAGQAATEPAAARPRTGASDERSMPAPEKKERDVRSARAGLRDAEAMLRTAEAEERDTRRGWERAQKDLERARAAADRAWAAAEESRAALDEARASVEAARATVDEARAVLEEARRQGDGAQRDVNRPPRAGSSPSP